MKIKKFTKKQKIECIDFIIDELNTDYYIFMCHSYFKYLKIWNKINEMNIETHIAYQFPEFNEMINLGGVELEGDDYILNSAWTLPETDNHGRGLCTFKLQKLKELKQSLNG